MRILVVLFALLAAVAARADESLPLVLEQHLRADVAYWVAEPRLFELLRENNRRNSGLSDAEVARLEARWQSELDVGSGTLTNHMMSRFASKYFAEVALRMDGAYGHIVALDNRGLAAAASDMTEHYGLAGDALLARLADKQDAAWVFEPRPEADRFTRVALPLKDPNTGARVGTLLLTVDVSRLARMASMRANSVRLGSTRAGHETLSAVESEPSEAATRME